jgi:hypothetical protein
VEIRRLARDIIKMTKKRLKKKCPLQVQMREV